jgi:hypothetical protein
MLEEKVTVHPLFKENFVRELFLGEDFAGFFCIKAMQRNEKFGG